LRSRPEEGFLHAEVLSDAIAVAGVGDASTEPAADGLGVHFAYFCEQLGCDAALGEYGVESLVHRHIQVQGLAGGQVVSVRVRWNGAFL
jgi:hypothetical protein